MSAIDGQIDIFGQIEGGETPPEVEVELNADGQWVCPHCRYTWSDPHHARGGPDGLAAWHLTGWNDGGIEKPITQGNCTTQDLYLEWLHTRRDAVDRKTIAWSKDTDLLGLILQCLVRGCTQDEIRAALAVEWRTS